MGGRSIGNVPSARRSGETLKFLASKKKLKHTSLVPNSKTGSHGSRKLLVWDTKLIFQGLILHFWTIMGGSEYRPNPTHLISFLALGLAFNWRSKYKVPKAEVTMTPTMAANSGCQGARSEVKKGEGFRPVWFLPSFSGGVVEKTQNGKICAVIS